MKLSYVGLLVVVAAVTSTGCNGSASIGPTSPDAATSTRPPVQVTRFEHVAKRGWMLPIVKTGVPLIYVGDNNCDCIHEYLQENGALVGLITEAVGSPGGLATDTSGNLYVSTGSNVAEYAPGATSPFKILADSQTSDDVVVADDGTVYVSNYGSTPSVFVYAGGATKPTSELFDAAADDGLSVALDKHGNLYWGAQGGSGDSPFVDEFVGGKGLPVRTKIVNILAQWMTFVPDNRLVISDYNIPTVDEYALPSKFLRHVEQTGTPFGIALNTHGRLFVADHFNHQIEVYDFATGVLVHTFTTATFYPTGLALFPRFQN